MSPNSVIVIVGAAFAAFVLITRALLTNIEYNRGVYRTEFFVVKELKNKALKYKYACQLTSAGKKRFGRKITTYGNTIEEALNQAKNVLRGNK